MESLADGEREARAVKKHGHPVEEVTADDGFSAAGTRVQSAPLSTSDATRTSSSLSGEPT